MSIKLQFQSAKNHYNLSEKQLNKIIILNSCEFSIQLDVSTTKNPAVGLHYIIKNISTNTVKYFKK